MTRFELIKILVGQARSNGFEFRRWYTTKLDLPWSTAEAALKALDQHRHYYALLFSHDFAQTFWKPGKPITFQVPARAFERRMADGTLATVQRKAFIRRSGRPDAWRYHLREMALAEEPLRYMRRYLHVADEPDEIEPDRPAGAKNLVKPVKPTSATLALARKAHERKQLALNAKPIVSTSKRGARVPGSQPKSG